MFFLKCKNSEPTCRTYSIHIPNQSEALRLLLNAPLLSFSAYHIDYPIRILLYRLALEDIKVISHKNPVHRAHSNLPLICIIDPRFKKNVTF